MRLAYLLALAALLPLALGPADTEAQPRIGSVVLELGSSQQEALSRLRSTYQVEEVMAGTWTVTQRSEDRHHFLGSVGFDEDRLVTVSRDWMPEAQDDAIAVMGAAIDALTSVAESAAEPCDLAPGERTEPGGSVSSIEVRCGSQGVSISIVESRVAEGVTISESWRLRSEQR